MADWPAPTWLRLAAFALASRVVTVAAGLLLAPHDTGPHWTFEQKNKRIEILGGPVGWLEPWVRFDAGYYLAIAEVGYAAHDSYGRDVHGHAAFLPLLPWCIALASKCGIPPVLAAVVIPNLAFVAGLACAGRVALRVFGSAATVWLGCGVLVTFPTAFYFSAPYQESLFLLAASGGLLAWDDRRPAIAGAASFVAPFARLTAVAFPIGVLIEAWSRRQRPSLGAWIVVAATAAGVLTFLWLMDRWYRDPFAHFQAHAKWGRESPSLGGLGRALAQAFRELVQPNPAYAVVKPIALFGTLALGIRGWVKRGPLWGCLILIPMAQALSTGTTLSVERIVLTSFPAAFELGEILGRSRMMRVAWLAVAVPAQGFFLWLFVNNGFVN